MRFGRFRRLLSALVIGLSVLPCAASEIFSQDESSPPGGVLMAPERAAEVAAYRLIDAAIAKDGSYLDSLFSAQALAINGHDELLSYFNEVLVPFFANHRRMGRTGAINVGQSKSGQTVYGFFLYSIQADGSARPFTIVVVQDGSEYRVAQVFTDTIVRGGHRPESEQ